MRRAAHCLSHPPRPSQAPPRLAICCLIPTKGQASRNIFNTCEDSSEETTTACQPRVRARLTWAPWEENLLRQKTPVRAATLAAWRRVRQDPAPGSKATSPRGQSRPEDGSFPFSLSPKSNSEQQGHRQTLTRGMSLSTRRGPRPSSSFTSYRFHLMRFNWNVAFCTPSLFRTSAEENISDTPNRAPTRSPAAEFCAGAVSGPPARPRGGAPSQGGKAASGWNGVFYLGGQ